MQSKVDPYLFTPNDYIIITYVDGCLIFYKKKEVLDDLIKSLEKEFKLTDEGDLASFLRIQFNINGKNKLELLQPHLIQRIIEALGLNEEYKIHNTPSNTILTKDVDRKARK